MIVFSLSAVSADDLQTTDSGQVSGDVDVKAVNPGTQSGELTYDIPANATVRSADVYVNVYSGSASNTYGANANVSLKTENGENQIASEELWIEDGSTDGTIYTVNNHTTKCYSDYQMHYDITDFVNGLNGTSMTINVNTFNMSGKQFDGRIKLIALVFAYDDGDDDAVSYYIDSTQKWTKTNVTTKFDTDLAVIDNAKLYNVVLSSGDGSYKVNGEFLGDADNHTSGGFYFQYNDWNVTDKMQAGKDTEITASYAGTSSYGSLKSVLTVLKVNTIKADASLATEYASTCYAGTNNTITVTANSNRAGKYLIELLADGAVVNSSEVELDGESAKTILLTDPTVRPIDETTVNGANNTEVVYAANVKFGGVVVNSANITVPVLYNGNLGQDMEYNVPGYSLLIGTYITGDVKIDVKDSSSYLAAADMNRTDVWAVNLDKDSEIMGAYLFIPYNWFNFNLADESDDMFNLTFNGEAIDPVAYFRDQSNLGKYGRYGYGVLIYDVEDLLNTTGDNTLVLNKIYATPAVYPSALVYMYNTPGGTIKEVSIIKGVDLLANSNNKAGRIAKSDSQIYILSDDIATAELYIFAAGAAKGEGNIIVNREEFVDVWSGDSKTTDLIFSDVTDLVKTGFNDISFVATGSTILALPQMIVVDTNLTLSIDSVATEYTSVPCVYAGTNNTFTVKISSNKDVKATVTLYADGIPVDSIDANLTNGTNTVLLTDPVIMPIDETTVSGANNHKVNYTVVVDHNGYADFAELTLPVLYNGNLGYDFEYNVTGLTDAFPTIVITGDVVIDVKDSGYLAAKVMNRTDVWTVNLDDGSELVNGLLFVPYNWFNSNLAEENETMFNLTFNGQAIEPIAYYRDQGNLGKYGKYGYGIIIYDVKDLLNTTGDNTLVLNKKYETPAVYPSALVYMYNTPGGSVKEVSMVCGADLLANSSNIAGRIVKTDSVIEIDNQDVVNATLYVIAAGAQKGEGNIIFNGKEYADVWSGSSSTTDLFAVDITDSLAESNNISFVATGSTILALPQIIVADSDMVLSVDSVKTEYSNTCYAGTNNTLTVTVSNSKAGLFDVFLIADGQVVDHVNVTLENGTNTVLLTDPTIRPVDETTVNGAANKKVTYSAVLVYQGAAFERNITVPVLYDGYLGKDMEYDAEYIEDITVIRVTGGIVVDILDDSTYIGNNDLNRTDVWKVTLGETQSINKAFIYLAYNWDKSGPYGPEVDTTFNGKVITPIAVYRDQSNLGSSGVYGYGLLIYDVTKLIQNDTNTLVINKPKGLTAFYPSNLMYLYDDTESNFRYTFYIADGADLLYASKYNDAGRIVKTDAKVFTEIDNIADAHFLIFAASADPGDSDLVLNGNEFTNIWNGTSKSLEVYDIGAKDIIDEFNEVSFVSTGGTVLALSQIFATSKIINPELPEIIIDADSGAVVGDNISVVITIPGATGSIAVSSDIAQPDIIILDENSTATYVIENATAGTHGVLVQYFGDGIYASGSAVALFDVAKKPTTIDIITPVGYNVGDDVNVTVSIPGASGNVTVYVDSIENVVALQDGIAIVPIYDLAIGEYSIVAIYDGDDTYEAAVNASSLFLEMGSSQFVNITIYDDLRITAVLMDQFGDPIANAPITCTIGSANSTVTTLADGSFTVQVVDDEVSEISYAGNEGILPTSFSVTLKGISPAIVRTESRFNITGNSITIKGYAIDKKAGETGMTYATELLDINGNPISNVTIQFAINDKIHSRVTYENGSFEPYVLNMLRAGRYTLAFSFGGNDQYNSTFAVVCVDLDKKPITIKASAKTYKASAKTKKYTATLSTIAGSSADGKVHLRTGLKVTMDINGKSYTGSTNSKGQVSFNLQLTKKGTYNAKISYAGDQTYNSASKTVKITIN